MYSIVVVVAGGDEVKRRIGRRYRRTRMIECTIKQLQALGDDPAIAADLAALAGLGDDEPFRVELVDGTPTVTV